MCTLAAGFAAGDSSSSDSLSSLSSSSSSSFSVRSCLPGTRVRAFRNCAPKGEFPFLAPASRYAEGRVVEVRPSANGEFRLIYK